MIEHQHRFVNEWLDEQLKQRKSNAGQVEELRKVTLQLIERHTRLIKATKVLLGQFGGMYGRRGYNPVVDEALYEARQLTKMKPF